MKSFYRLMRDTWNEVIASTLMFIIASPFITIALIVITLFAKLWWIIIKLIWSIW